MLGAYTGSGRARDDDDGDEAEMRCCVRSTSNTRQVARPTPDGVRISLT